MFDLDKYEVVLASKSPQRREILDKVLKKYIVVPSSFPEDVKCSDPKEYVELTALGKTDEVFGRLYNSSRSNLLVIGADTIITLDGRIYEKPKDEGEAIKTLTEFSGRNHTVITAVCLKTNTKCVRFIEETKVSLGRVSEKLIRDYVATGDCMYLILTRDKAGSYGYQSLGGVLVEKIEGCYYNVVGLPLYRLIQKLKEFIDEDKV